MPQMQEHLKDLTYMINVNHSTYTNPGFGRVAKMLAGMNLLMVVLPAAMEIVDNTWDELWPEEVHAVSETRHLLDRYLDGRGEYAASEWDALHIREDEESIISQVVESLPMSVISSMIRRLGNKKNPF